MIVGVPSKNAFAQRMVDREGGFLQAIEQHPHLKPGCQQQFERSMKDKLGLGLSLNGRGVDDGRGDLVVYFQ